MSCRVFHFCPELRPTVRRGRAQELENKRYALAFIRRPHGPNFVRSYFTFAVDFVSRFTNSTLVAEPGRPGLPTCALRDNELFVPAETRGTIGSSSSRSGLVDSSSTCSPHPSRALCPCEQLHATSWSKERKAAGVGIDLTRWHFLYGPEGQLCASLHRPKEDAFKKVIETLDANFAYDAKVQLPTDFEAYFNLLQRSPGQTLLLYVADHEEAYRKLQQHRIELPASVQGWRLLRRSGLPREQRESTKPGEECGD